MQSMVTRRSMGRPPREFKRTSVWLPRRLGARIAGLLRGKETQADFIRAGIEREIRWRIAEKKRK